MTDGGPIDTNTNGSQRGVLSRLYHGENRWNIVGRWKMWFAISGVFLLIGGVTLATKGLNLGIDFTGGTVWEVPAGDATVADATEAMDDLGYSDVQVQEFTQAGGTRVIRVEADAEIEPAVETTDALDGVAAQMDDLVAVVPDSEADRYQSLSESFDAIEGPFAEPVPAQIETTSASIDKLIEDIEAADEADAAAIASTGAEGLQDLVDELARLQSEEQTRLGQDVSTVLAELTGATVEEVTVDTVGPSWGRQISEKARTALIVFLIAITLFITIRFELKMAIATVVALFHDLFVVVGLYALFGFAVTPSTVVALLTMLGFSIYDGIVVFDRIDENTPLASRKSKMTYTEMANLSLNQVLMRSLNTSITTLLPILSVLVIGALALGATTLEEFGMALFLGLLAGAYSSFFIATPLLALLKEREDTYRQIRSQVLIDRQQSGESVSADLEPAGAGSARLGGENPVAPGSEPRPRKRKGRS